MQGQTIMITKHNTILYVDDQAQSTAFYARVLGQQPNLNVPGMTEFELTSGSILGLMPTADIVELLAEKLPANARPEGLMRAELYLMVDDPAAYHRRAVEAGARNISDLARRSWGHVAAYCLDPDGHVLAFAREEQTSR
jgi:catechol 2,3-dioxygenase-like lactoylglutathione lyase family enzyme